MSILFDTKTKYDFITFHDDITECIVIIVSNFDNIIFDVFIQKLNDFDFIKYDTINSDGCDVVLNEKLTLMYKEFINLK